MTLRELVIAPDLEGASHHAAAAFAEVARQAIEQRRACYLALAGGSTPRRLYQVLASGEHPLDWSRCIVFWSDERCVPPGDPESNYRLAQNELLSKVAVREEQVFRLRGEIDPERAAAEYEQAVRDAVPAGADRTPRFDLLLLGLGADGHTASIFPGSPLLDDTGERLVAAVYVPHLDAQRLTFTPRLLNAGRNVIFLVAGADKAEALAAVLEGEGPVGRYPTRAVAPVDGRVLWFIDEAAASRLNARAWSRS